MKKSKSIGILSAALVASLFGSTVIAIPDREVRWDGIVA
jgi:hypothetical protein